MEDPHGPAVHFRWERLPSGTEIELLSRDEVDS